MNTINVTAEVTAEAVKDTGWLNMLIFGLFVAVTLVVVLRASRNNKTAADYYAAGRSFTGPQNGTAIAGTTCRRHPSWALSVPSPSTATTASCTPSASWWPGWWHCCWSRKCCATPANSPWPTCFPSG
ncbi:hypothetical protein GCM10017708_38960 [Arthrobacter citreus]